MLLYEEKIYERMLSLGLTSTVGALPGELSDFPSEIFKIIVSYCDEIAIFSQDRKKCGAYHNTNCSAVINEMKASRNLRLNYIKISFFVSNEGVNLYI